jgi:hypothetical protein
MYFSDFSPNVVKVHTLRRLRGVTDLAVGGGGGAPRNIQYAKFSSALSWKEVT